jgi:hypothetical protein
MLSNKKFARFTLRLAAASVIALVPAGAALADPNLPNVGRHQHYLETPDGDLVPIGPNLCDNPDLQEAFNQFHFNIHDSRAVTKGPQDGAPGLHNDLGGDMVFLGCPEA